MSFSFPYFGHFIISVSPPSFPLPPVFLLLCGISLWAVSDRIIIINLYGILGMFLKKTHAQNSRTFYQTKATGGHNNVVFLSPTPQWFIFSLKCFGWRISTQTWAWFAAFDDLGFNQSHPPHDLKFLLKSFLTLFWLIHQVMWFTHIRCVNLWNWQCGTLNRSYGQRNPHYVESD